MFPKFLRVSTYGGVKHTEWINETTSIEVTRPYPKDQKMLDTITRSLGCSYEIVFPSDGTGFGKRLENGSLTGALGMLQRQEVDMVFGDLNMDEELYDDFRLSFPHTIAEITFMTRKHEHVPDTAVFLHPFSIQVWFSIIACICLMPLLFYYLFRKKYPAVNLFASTIGSLIGQGISLIPRSLREYTILGSWILSSALLYYFYASVLLSFLTFPSLHGIRTIEDLGNGIKYGKYHSSTYPNAPYNYHFKKSDSPAMRVIGSNLDENRGAQKDNFIEFLEASVSNNRPAFVGARLYFLPYKNYYFLSDENFLFFTGCYAVNKKFCCGSELDKAVHRIWASGLFSKYSAELSDYYFRINSKAYGKYWENSSSETKLTLTLLKGPFVFLVASHSLAFLVFLIEVFIGKVNKVRCF